MTVFALQFKPVPARAFAEEVMETSGQNITACYQCRRCAAGCPVAEETGNVTPDLLIRLVAFGDREAALNNELVWKCVSCYTCGTRCPNNIHTARVTETLKKMAGKNKIKPLRPNIAFFHSSFLNSGLRWGRVNEAEFMGFYELKHLFSLTKEIKFKAVFDEIVQQAKFGWMVLKHGRMHFGFLTAKGRDELKRLRKVNKKTGNA